MKMSSMSSMLSLVASVIDLSWFCSISATSDSEGGRYLNEGSQQLEMAIQAYCMLTSNRESSIC